jgi:TonB family protein
MENDLKFALTISILLHVALFIFASLHSKRIIYVNIPVDLFFYTTPSPQEEPKVEKEEKKEEEIVIPKKSKKKKEEKKTVKKEVKEKEEAKPQAKTFAPSSQISVDSARFPYAYYLRTVKNKINSNWEWSEDFGSLRILVYFSIGRDGIIRDLRIDTSSRDKLFDQQAVRAVKLSEPFPPLPFDYNEDKIEIMFEFRNE